MMCKAGMLGANREKGWDISKAVSVSSPQLTPKPSGTIGRQLQGLSFKPDGTKLYVIDLSADQIDEYDLTLAWDVTTLLYVQSFSVSTQENTPTGLFIRPDGLEVFIIGGKNDEINGYSLSSAWDISTSVHSQTFNAGAYDSAPTDLFFSDDGTQMYFCGNSGNDINQFLLSTPWSLASASFVQNFSVASQDTSPLGLAFKGDGSRMYVVGSLNDDVYQYDLSTAWDISTASYVQAKATSADPRAVSFKTDGLFMYVLAFDAAIQEYPRLIQYRMV